MKHEFTKIENQGETRYVLETASVGATSTAGGATLPSALGSVQRRDRLLTPAEGQDNTVSVPASKPRNFVAKNAKMGGAGQHRDKKKEQKAGQEKHKKPYFEDHEISMASNELTSIVEDAMRLLKLVQRYSEMEGLEAWQQSKITKAADYLNSVLNSLQGEEVLKKEDHSNFNNGWGQNSYDTYAGGNHGRGVAEGYREYDELMHKVEQILLKAYDRYGTRDEIIDAAKPAAQRVAQQLGLEKYFDEVWSNALASHDVDTDFGDNDDDFDYTDYSMRKGERGMEENLGKTVGRALAGWGVFDKDTPADIIKKVQSLDTATLKTLLSNGPIGKGSPAELQQKAIRRELKRRSEEGTGEEHKPQEGDEVYYGTRLVGWFKGYSQYGKIITEPNVDEMGDEYFNKDVYWEPQKNLTIKPKKDVAEGSLNEEAGNMVIRKLITDFNEQMSGSPYFPLDYKDVGMRSWTRGDGSRYKDPGYIFVDRDMKPEDIKKYSEQKPVEKFWDFLSSKGAKKIGDVSGEFGSDPHSPAVVLGKLIFVFNGRNIAWGSTSRLKNSSVWRQKQQQGVAEADKHSFIGRIQRHNELKKKVDSTWQDAADAEKRGDKVAANRAFNKHVKYANLERPGTWTDVKEQDVAEGNDSNGFVEYKPSSLWKHNVLVHFQDIHKKMRAQPEYNKDPGLMKSGAGMKFYRKDGNKYLRVIHVYLDKNRIPVEPKRNQKESWFLISKDGKSFTPVKDMMAEQGVAEDGEPYGKRKNYGREDDEDRELRRQAAAMNREADRQRAATQEKNKEKDMSEELNLGSDTDDILEQLTAAYRKCVQNRDSYTNFRNIQTVYELLRDPLMKGDLAGYEKMWDYTSGKYPDAFDLLMDEIPGQGVDEDWEKTIKAMKKHPELTHGKTKSGKEKSVFALANWMKKKGYKSHKEDAYMEDLANKVAEKLDPNADVDVWVQDFQTADPNKYHQFRNKTPEKKARMAVAARYAAKNPSKK